MKNVCPKFEKKVARKPKAIDLDRHHPGAPSTEDEEWRQNRSTEYRTAANILQKQDLLSVVLRVAVFDDPAVLNPAGGMELRSNLCGALQLLAHLWSKKPSCTTRAPTPSAHSTTNAGHP